MSEQSQRLTNNDDHEGWKAYWAAQGMPWRTEPEIDEERQHFLAERRAITPDIEKGIYPFRNENGGIKLTRADVEWLLATHESGGMQGPVEWSDKQQHKRDGLDLRGADVRRVDLSFLPLARLQAGLPAAQRTTTWHEQRYMAASRLQGARLFGAHLEQAELARSFLDGVDCEEAHLEQADLGGAFLRRATFRNSYLQGASLSRAFMDTRTNMNAASVGDKDWGIVTVLDAEWGGTNLAYPAWLQLQRLGDDISLPGFPKVRNLLMEGKSAATAVRAYRQMAIAFRGQGLTENAEHFNYRAQVLRRRVLRHQGIRGWLIAFGSWFLDLVSGYGHRPLRSFITYVVVVGAFAGVYALLAHFGLTAEHFGSWDSPLVLSVTSFHGRVFFAGELPLTDWAARVGAVEAAIGLLVEIIFIATFTQRFFAR